jgi:TonB-linked SusC/RagA family outer membrane protein
MSHLRTASHFAWLLLLLAAPPLLAQGAGGTISGVVRAIEARPVPEARVSVVGTSITTLTGADGRYTLRGVPNGSQVVRVNRVGYQEQKRTVLVEAAQALTADFVLQQSVVNLPEVVTTATGEQRRVEIGNAVANIDVAKTVETSPIKNMGDLLVAKAPGVQVLPGNMTGAGSRVRIRGVNSLSLANEPIYIIDGIRMVAGTGGIGVGGTTISRVNDLNPDDIENIEIVKGPSAATLYGTDAANGVIVITTKRGRAGPARWTVFAEGGYLEDRNNYPSQYAIWGKNAAGASTRCVLQTVATGACRPDSTTTLNIFDDPDLTPIQPGWRDNYGVQVSGGTDVVRYYVSADLEREVGTVGLPDFEQRRFDSLGVAVRDEWERPNTLNKKGIRANLNAAINSRLDLAVNANYVQQDIRRPQVDNNVNSYFYNGTTGPGFKGPGLGRTNIGSLGQPLYGYNLFTPADIFQIYNNNSVQRFIGSINANWRPLSWLQSRADFGTDVVAGIDETLCRFSECADFGTNRRGSARDARGNRRNITANLGVTGTWQAMQNVSLNTTAGAQYVNVLNHTNDAQGSELPPGAQTPSQGTIPNVGSGTTVTKTLGVFIEEQAAINDRLFLTAAVRSDQNSAFGTNFQRVFYPKASVSWVMSEESFFPRYDWLSQFRLRSSYGAAGVQPGSNDALRTFNVVTTNIASSDISGLRSNALGNSDLKPERTTEFEAGFDLRMLQDRFTFEGTYYSKLSKDALIDQTIAPSAGSSSATKIANLGSVKNAGIEGLINARLIDLNSFGWDLTINASHNTNKLVSLGVVPPIIGATTRQIPGYPLNGYWLRPYTFRDANNDGIIHASEVTVDTAFQFKGYSIPRDEVVFVNGVELLRRRLRLQAMVDYKGGGNVNNSEQSFLCQQSTSCPGISVIGSSLEEQARAVANRYTSIQTPYGYFEHQQFWRLREVSATVTLPESFAARFLRSRAASLNLAARNLKTWTKFTGIDPEANYSLTQDTQQNLLTQGPPMYLTARINLNF